LRTKSAFELATLGPVAERAALVRALSDVARVACGALAGASVACDPPCVIVSWRINMSASPRPFPFERCRAIWLSNMS